MLTIKYVWFYVIVFAATTAGIGVGMVSSPSQSDIEKALRLQAEEIAAMDCSKEGGSWKKAPVVESPSRGF
jgi:hypothetical protein